MAYSPRLAPSLIGILATFSLLGGCASNQKTDSLHHAAPAQQQPTTTQRSDKPVAPETEVSQGPAPAWLDAATILESERNRAACYHLQPGVTTTKVVPVKPAAKSVHGSGKKGKKAAGHHAHTKVVRTTSRCQPQSLIYARCRTGFATCKLGDTSPTQWFACAQKNQSTTVTPVAGSVMVVDVHKSRRIHTGHPAYVEAVQKNSDGTWTLRISHTNYDRACHLDQDANVLFNSTRMTASFLTGPWHAWAKDLKVLGFILR